MPNELGADHAGRTISAWGGYSYVKHTFDRKRKPYVKGGYWALSGSDPKKPKVVGDWDPLFSQWPEWSDGYVYTLNRERGIAYWTNLHMSQAEAGFAPVPKTTLAFVWYHMNSFYPFAGTPKMFAQGTTRGEDYQVRLEYNPTPNWKAYVHYEPFCPGDFYAASRAPAYEVQALVQYRFSVQPLKKYGH